MSSAEPRAAGRPELLARLRDEIDQRGPLSFSRFMELALYDSQHGYYNAGPERVGPAGDFITASDVGRELGRCLARQLEEIDELLGEPRPFDLIEHGAGRGLLARDALDALADNGSGLAGRLRCTLADRSPGMRAAAASSVPEARVVEPDEVGGGRVGCAVAVELFDALPVDRVRRRDGGLVEIRVGMDETGNPVEVERPAAPELIALAAQRGAAEEDGSEAELVPDLGAALARLTAPLERGVLLIVDYGDRGRRRYGESRRQGTMLAYHAHTADDDLLSRIGEQDLTADVDFGGLEDEARRQGWAPLGYTTQDRFLIANGILDCFEQSDVDESRDPRRVKRRMQAMHLIHPHAMGRRFKVLALGRGLGDGVSLRGLSDPFARDGAADTRGAR